MDYSPLIVVASSFLGMAVGALGGWFTVQGKILQINAQKKADAAQAALDIAAAQNAVAVRQKIGQIAAGAIEQDHKDAPPEEKRRLALEYAQVLSAEAKTPSTDAQMLPNVLAGVAALPATHPITDATMDEVIPKG